MLQGSTIKCIFGKFKTVNLLSLAAASGSAAQLYLELLHCQFGVFDLMNCFQIALVSGNPFVMRLVLNYAAPLFRRAEGGPTAQIAQINQTRKRFNAQNQGHQLPLLRETGSAIQEKLCDIQQILTAYFADKLSLLYESQEPLFFAEADLVQGDTPRL